MKKLLTGESNNWPLRFGIPFLSAMVTLLALNGELLDPGTVNGVGLAAGVAAITVGIVLQVRRSHVSG